MITYAALEHVHQMSAEGLREADVLEIQAGSGRSPHVALLDSFLNSSKCWTLLDAGTACGMWGVGPADDSSVGVPWLLATPRFDLLRNRKRLLHHTRRFVAEMGEGFRALVNFTDVRHTESHRWLQWAGFTLSRPIPLGSGRFYPFHLRTSNV